jgi:hypothetical protein
MVATVATVTGGRSAHRDVQLAVAGRTAQDWARDKIVGATVGLAVSIRDDATMRVKIEVSRARMRTSAKIILGSVAATIVMLFGLNRNYLDAYDTLAGQGVLAVVAVIFVFGGWLLATMSELDLPERFVPRQDGRP